MKPQDLHQARKPREQFQIPLGSFCPSKVNAKHIRGDAGMNGECALWGQQFLLLEGLRPAPSPVTLLGFSEGPAAALLVTQEPKSRPGLGQLQQEHPGSGLSWAQGVQCLLLLHRSAAFHGSTCLAANCQVMRKPSPTPCVLVVCVRGEIASLGSGGEESCSGFRGVASR